VITRILPEEEWPSLAGTMLEQAPTLLNPASDIVLVLEDDHKILACTAFLPRWHMEGTWIAPEYRKMASVGRPLLRGMRKMAKTLGARELLMVTINPEVSAICLRLGKSSTWLQGDHFSIEL
jgi:N-acetylglutamate synthase-like GNAT family acetyltransferase|tara:strand:+ start:6183 stop:6548 length:366 start_codon:yes stop_codon:yes gene_type:complete